MVGQGKICVRLNIDTVTVIKGTDDNDLMSEENAPSSLEASSSSSLEASSSSSLSARKRPLVPYNFQTPKLNQLKEMFPSKLEHELIESLKKHNSLNDAITENYML